MAKGKNNTEQEQLDLIEMRPQNAKEILQAAKAYKKAQKIRLNALAQEVKAKQAVLDFIKKAKLTPLDDGTIRFTLDSVKICVKPRDELLTVKYENEDE